MMRRTLVLFALLDALAMAACDRSGEPRSSAPADARSVDATALAAHSAGSASTQAWPRVVPLPEPAVSVASSASGGLEAPPNPTDEVRATSDASVLLADARAETGAMDARADNKSPYEEAPLLGTKTYPEETPMRGIRRVTSQAAKVHKAPKDGVAITSLPKGTEISLVAELWDWYRVRYTDPNTSVRRQGWVYFVNFAGPRQKSCPEGWTWHAQDGGFCDRECTRNVDCRALKGYKCSGTLCFYAAD